MGEYRGYFMGKKAYKISIKENKLNTETGVWWFFFFPPRNHWICSNLTLPSTCNHHQNQTLVCLNPLRQLYSVTTDLRVWGPPLWANLSALELIRDDTMIPWVSISLSCLEFGSLGGVYLKHTFFFSQHNFLSIGFCFRTEYKGIFYFLFF